MQTCEEVYKFLVNRVEQLTEDWYKKLDKVNSTGIYASSNPEEIQILKEQNKEFHMQFFQVFLKEEPTCLKQFEEWIWKITQDESHLTTPTHLILREYYRIRDLYLDLIKEFVSLHEGEYSQKVIDAWHKRIIDTMDKVTVWFMEEYHKSALKRLQNQQELINELSSPIIVLNKNTGLLPLVGDIDPVRAKFILEKTLKQCARKNLDRLFIDLSGVVAIDTMVAQQLFHLYDALGLIGVKATLSGIRPEIAQTVIQLGLSFDKVQVTSTLERVLKDISVTI